MPSAFEPFNTREGLLTWVAASASANANSNVAVWATGATPASGILGLVTDFSFRSGQDLYNVMERGTPVGFKQVGIQVIQIQMTFQWTGSAPLPTAMSGRTVPAYHLEHKAFNSILLTSYHQFINAVPQQRQFTENDQANTLQMTWNALAVLGPTASGYLG